MGRTLRNIADILIPYEIKKTNDCHLLEYVTSFNSHLIRALSPGYIYKDITKFLSHIKSPGRHYCIQTNLIVHKFKVLQQLRYEFALRNPVNAKYIRPITELRALRFLFRLYMLSVRVVRADRIKLDKIRYFSNIYRQNLMLSVYPPI